MKILDSDKIRLLDDVQELADVVEAMKRAVNNGNDLRLQDHIVRMHELNLRLAKAVNFEGLRAGIAPSAAPSQEP
jgi:hypothetical protein